MLLQRPGNVLADRLADHRGAGAMHRLAVAADQIVPFGQGRSSARRR
jgi:hypothetical protein